ncbi:hypothetical protein [Nocardioides aurantiacus]|uniref:Uncharacterized protein n=1 Tax=Nocardioides aurantiacus TaxID=86796 RepID=A0A3N2CTM6_9ACTN|nr:hypothetical protein [Nocardioides aurantiacus]ROR90889.1 hypothetical protein EDD33_1738 [Nocardioides aurantiacus]
MEQRQDESWPDRFWGEFENLLSHEFQGHTKQVYATEANTMVVVWRGPLPASVETRFRPLIESGDLELVRHEPDVLDHLIRHLQVTLGRARLAEVDDVESIAATADVGRLVLVLDQVVAHPEHLQRVVNEKAHDYGISLDLRLPR